MLRPLRQTSWLCARKEVMKRIALGEQNRNWHVRPRGKEPRWRFLVRQSVSHYYAARSQGPAGGSVKPLLSIGKTGAVQVARYS